MTNIIHPLDSLSKEEIEKSIALFKLDKNSDKNSVFSYITLEEPEKEFVKKFKSGDPFSRQSRIVGIDSNSKGFEVLIDLTREKVISSISLPEEAGPTYTMTEILTAIQLTLENEQYQEALKKRGITDLNLIQIDPWPGGGIVNKNIKRGHRALKTISFLKENPSDNAYA